MQHDYPIRIMNNIIEDTRKRINPTFTDIDDQIDIISIILKITQICPMKKDHPIFVQYLFKSVWKSYNYCSFLDKNGHAEFYSVLKVCDFCTIENKLKFRIQKMFNFCTIKILGYKNCVIIV